MSRWGESVQGVRQEIATRAQARAGQKLYLAKVGLDLILPGIVVDVSDINPPSACDLAPLVNLAQRKGAVRR